MKSKMKHPDYKQLKDTHPNNHSAQGWVSIVGAGPGALGLLTLKAYQTINDADIIFYDNLVSDEIVRSFPRKARSFFVGKSKNNHSVPQNKINPFAR